MATIVGGRWRALDYQTRAYYDMLATNDKLRYKRETKEYRRRVAHANKQQQRANDSPAGAVAAYMEEEQQQGPGNIVPTVDALAHYDVGIPDLSRRLDSETKDLIINMFLDG